ncbi:MAG: hypothetical protein ACREPX_00145 [Rhodanobacteraceae bacterium]
MKLLALTVTLVLVSGCTAAVKSAEGVADADAAGVANCAFVKDVEGSSVFGGRGLVEQGIAKAKQQARESAAAAGANTIVWGDITSPDISKVTGKAYRCAK